MGGGYLPIPSGQHSSPEYSGYIQRNPKEDSTNWRKMVECFNCHQKGHIQRFCPKKTTKEEKKPVKARVADTDVDNAEEEYEEGSLLEELTSRTEDVPPALISFLTPGRALPEDEKFYLMRRHAEGTLPKELDF